MKKKKSKKKTSFISKTAMTVLTIILIILFFCIMSMVEKIQGTARVVNYAGLVRGKTQRIIKLEDAGEPQDTMIADINAYIDGLQNGSSEQHGHHGRGEGALRAAVPAHRRGRASRHPRRAGHRLHL